MSSTSKKPFIGGLVESNIDVKVYQDILQTYSKETISFPNYGNLSITNIDQKTISRVQFTECEISPFHKGELDCETTQEAAFDRKPSTPMFNDKNINFLDIQQLLIHSFSPNQAGQRPYPSAGGLYPIEPLVFLFEEKIDHQTKIQSGCYHFRPISQKLQFIKKIDKKYFLETLLHGFVDSKHAPCLGILYIAHIGKSIFKYRYRGYRHALMEAGSMYQQATIISQQMGMRNTVWSTFSDHEMLYALDLEYGTYLPLTMQLFGYSE